MINREQLDAIISRIVSTINLEKLILFGSYAYGEPAKDSDLDLLVVVKHSKQPRYKRAREIRKHLWGISDIPKDILVYTEDEIAEWKDVEDAFITTIVREGKVLMDLADK
jgi:predicted nucleotidyltransferase